MIEVLSCFASFYLYSAIDCVFYNVTCEFTVNLDSIIIWMSKNSFLKTGVIYGSQETEIGLKQKVFQFANEHAFIQPKWPND